MFGVAEGAAGRITPPTAMQLSLASARASVLAGRGTHEDAVSVLEEALRLAESELGETHPSTANMLDALTVPLGKLHRYEDALELNARALAIRRDLEGQGHPAVARLLESRGILQYGKGRPADALQSMREAYAIRHALAPTAGPTVRLAGNLSSVLMAVAADRGTDEGERAEVLALLGPLARELESSGHADEPTSGMVFENLGSALMKEGRVEEGLRLIERGVASLEASHGPNSITLGPGLSKLASAELKLDRFEEARTHAKRARSIAIENDAGPANTARVELLLGMIEGEAGNADEARRMFRLAIDRARAADVMPLVERGEQALAALD